MSDGEDLNLQPSNRKDQMFYELNYRRFCFGFSFFLTFLLQAEEDSAATTFFLSIFLGSSVPLNSGLRMFKFNFILLIILTS